MFGTRKEGCNDVRRVVLPVLQRQMPAWTAAPKLLQVCHNDIQRQLRLETRLIAVHHTTEPVKALLMLAHGAVRIAQGYLQLVRPREHAASFAELLLQLQRPEGGHGANPARGANAAHYMEQHRNI